MQSQVPILIVAYNRPHYLNRVINSIKEQRDADLGGRKIALFQDGFRSRFASRDTTDKALVSENIRLFRDAFPNGEIFASDVNLGVGLNIDRAERYAFEFLNAPAAIFMEDDLVLSPCYFRVVEKLIDLAIDDERIGYVSAFGNYKADKQSQMEKKNNLRSLHLLWGFGLTKRHWEKCRPYVSDYLDIIKGRDYRDRDHAAVQELTASWGVKPGDTAQDRIKSFVTAVVGAVKLNTEPAYATYIGAQGNAFTPEMFEKWGFVGNECFQDPLSLDFDLSTVNFDPWHPSHNVWKLEETPSSPANPPRLAKAQMELVMSEAERSLFLSLLRCSKNYLEFGSGGSTVIASNTVSGHVWSVDSSKEWLDRVSQDESFNREKSTLHFVDVGPLGGWGWPQDKSKTDLFPSYSRSIWDKCRGAPIDLFLIDGRFRVACFAESIKRASPGSFIVVHDYENRPQYHIVERIARKIAVADTMAVFQTNGANFDLVNSISDDFRLDPN